MFRLTADVQPSAALSFLAELRAGGKSLKTANDYLAAVKGFTRWLWRDKRTPVDPLLAYRDAEGRYADFHSLRHTFVTAVGKTGASPKVHQELARHSSYAMTGRYTHARLHDLAATVAGMPSLIPPTPSTANAATGTHGRPADAPGGRHGAQQSQSDPKAGRAAGALQMRSPADRSKRGPKNRA